MSRIDVGLSSLVSALLPALPEDEEHLADERHEEALQLAKSILAEWVGSSCCPTSSTDKLSRHDHAGESYDIGHISDLIKKKRKSASRRTLFAVLITTVWREYNAPEKAIQFGNLYSRLLTLPILTKKQAILHLLNQLAIPGEDDASRGSESPQRYGSPAHQTNRQAQARPESQKERKSTLKDASPTHLNGLQNKSSSLQQKPEASKPSEGRKSENLGSERPHSKLDSNGIVPSESNLLRDLPFTLQGLSSTNLPFTSSSVLSLPDNLPLPLVSLLHRLAEPSLLYRSLSDFVQGRDEGLIGQSLRAAIGIELRSYLGLIATLEGEIRRAIASASESGASSSVTKVGVTLKRCVVWTRDATMGLRLMSLMAEESKSRCICQLFSQSTYAC